MQRMHNESCLLKLSEISGFIVKTSACFIHNILTYLLTYLLTYWVISDAMSCETMVYTGLSGTVKLDNNADRIANYRLWHLPQTADAYEDFIDIEMIDSVKGVVTTFELYSVAFLCKTVIRYINSGPDFREILRQSYDNLRIFVQYTLILRQFTPLQQSYEHS